MVRHTGLFEIANLTLAHTLFKFSGGSWHLLVRSTESQLPFVPGVPVFSVNKSKFDGRMNAAAYILLSNSNYMQAVVGHLIILIPHI